MKKILNTLYVTKEDAYLSIDGENIIINIPSQKETRFPLCNLEEIVCFSYLGVSPKLMSKCFENNISITFLTPSGKFCGKIIGKIKGNVFTRISQIKIFETEEQKITLIRNSVANKFLNTKYLLSRSLRDYKEIDEDNQISYLLNKISSSINSVYLLSDIEQIRGVEGEIAKSYFAVFSRLIRNNNFSFNGRSKRPPADEINACLSFLYVLQSNSITAALETAGIDPYIGFFHTERPGRASLSLDIVEEFRSTIERFVVSIINLKQLNVKDFEKDLSNGVYLTEDGRKKIIGLWQEKKKENIYHPFLKQNIQFGLLPFIQSSIMGKFLRGEINEYVPFYGK